jgi:5'-nucleotidase
LNRFTITGAQLKKIFAHIMRAENRDGEGECYQVSSGIAAVYNDSTRKLESLTYKGVPVQNTKFYKICLQGFHFNNSAEYLNISQEELAESGETKTVCTSAQGVLEEYLRNHQNISRKIEGRLVFKK